MRKTIFEIGVAVAAAALALLVTSWVGPVNATWKWMIIAVVAVVAFLAAWLVSRNPKSETGAGIEVGSRIRADGNVEVSDIEIDSSAAGTGVGNDLRAGRNVTVSKVRLGDSDGRKGKA